MAAPSIRHFTDVNFSFTAHPITGDVAVVKDANAIKQSVKNLILTNHYEVPFHPEQGSGITALLFENISQLTAVYIQRAIKDTLTNFEPRVTIKDITVAVSPDQNGYNVALAYFIQNISAPVTINLFLELLR